MKRTTTKTANGLIEARGKWYLRKSFHGKQYEVSLGTTVKSEAKTKATRFIATAQANGYEVALLELKGKAVLKKGDDPTFEKMELLYREFCKQSASSPREITIRHNLGCLRRLMADVKTVSRIDSSKLVAKMGGSTPSEKRSFASQIGCASNIFKRRALAYYHARGIKLVNPFVGMEIKRPKLEAYTPFTNNQRARIWNAIDEELPAVDAMIVLLALAAGLRRSEIEAARVGWFSPQDAHTALTVREEEGFMPKSGEKRIIPFESGRYRRLMELREKAVQQLSAKEETREGLRNSEFLIPVIQRKGSGGRLWGRFASVTTWLRSQGVEDQKPLHALRKEFGSMMATHHSIFVASKLLGHSDTKVTEAHYASLTRTPVVDVGAIIATQCELDGAKKQTGADETKAA